MKGAVLLAVLLWQAAAANEPPVAQPGAMQYERAIRVAGGERQGGAGQACAVLDAAIFAHAAPSLTDLRIFPAQAAAAGAAVHEVPYAITLSEAASEETEAARVLNLGASGAKIVFDLEMPARAYTDVTLDLDPAVHDFIATATVSGSDALGGKATALGSFTLFDLASQGLSRETTIPLAGVDVQVPPCGDERLVRARFCCGAVCSGDGAGRVGAAQPRGADDLLDGCGDRVDCDEGTRDRLPHLRFRRGSRWSGFFLRLRRDSPGTSAAR